MPKNLLRCGSHQVCLQHNIHLPCCLLFPYSSSCEHAEARLALIIPLLKDRSILWMYSRIKSNDVIHFTIVALSLIVGVKHVSCKPLFEKISCKLTMTAFTMSKHFWDLSKHSALGVQSSVADTYCLLFIKCLGYIALSSSTISSIYQNMHANLAQSVPVPHAVE